MLAVIINPKSGKKAYRKQRLYLFRLLQGRKIPFTYKVTRYAAHATELARELVEQGYDELLVLGGDGTLSEVIDGIMSSSVEDKSKIVFGLMPRGTGNDWGRYWGLNRKYKRSLEVFFDKGHKQSVDVGCLTLKRGEKEEKHYFINSVGFGIDALTCKKAQTMKYYFGSHQYSYFFALLAALFSHKAVAMRLHTDEGLTLTDPMFTMNIGNGPFSGGGIRQNPAADPTDGYFNAMFAIKPTFRQIMQAIPKLFNGRLGEIEFIKSFTAREVRLETDDYTVFEKDGIVVDACGPYTVSIIPHALTMIVP